MHQKMHCKQSQVISTVATITNRKAVNIEFAQPPAVTVKNPEGDIFWFC